MFQSLTTPTLEARERMKPGTRVLLNAGRIVDVGRLSDDWPETGYDRILLATADFDRISARILEDAR